MGGTSVASRRHDPAARPRGFGWAIVGPGSIARRFVLGLRSLEGEGRVLAVCGRDRQRSLLFTARMGLEGAVVTDSVSELLALPQIDAVYVATPHPSHCLIAEQAMRAGKAVLCEKPLTTCLADTRSLVETSRSEGVFLMEALWTRFLPVYSAVQQWLQLGRIGYLRSVVSSFCFPAQPDPNSRLLNPNLGGGVLLDIGIYNLAMTRWALAHACGSVPLGVDYSVAGTLVFANQVVAQFQCAFDRYADNSLVLHGSDGAIEVPHGFWGAEKAVLRRPGEPDLVVTLPHEADGLEYEIAEVMHCVRAGAVESSKMSLDESLALAAEVDQWMALARAVGESDSP